MRSDIFWIDGQVLAAGRLAVSARPRGGDWLKDEVDAWRRAGVRHVVSLLTPTESRELDLEAEKIACAEAGIEFNTVPAPDRGVPPSASEFRHVATKLGEELRQGKGVLVHCRQGIGRASMMAAAILADAGIDSETALQMIERIRGRPVPDTDEQRAWLASALPIARAANQQPGGADRASRDR
jgi:protein-tyrosine phosphatase